MSGSIDEDVHISSFHSYEMRMCIFYRQKGVIIILVIIYIYIYTKHCSHDFCNKINVNLHLIRRKDKHMKRSCVQLQYNFMSTQTAPCGLLHMRSIAWLTPDKNSVFFL